MARPRQGYHDADGRRIPGVTTVIGLLDKPALIGWAGKLCAEAGWEAGKTGQPMPYWYDVCYTLRDRAAEDGTTAHNLFERRLNGETVVRDGETDGAWQAFQNAERWLELNAVEFEVWPHERPLVSKNHGFGGTPDALAREPDGVIRLADWKTGGVYPEQVIQMAAYRQLLGEVGGVVTQGCHLVRFHRDHGDFHHHSYADDALDLGWSVFRALLETYKRLQRLKERVK